MPCSEFKNAADVLYQEIIGTTASAFELPDTEEFLDTLKIGVLKAKSTDKADIRIKIHDINTGYETVQGFSIKSRLGSPSTLVNAGRTTNFIFEVIGNINDDVMNEFNTCSKKFKDKFDVLNCNQCEIKYNSMENGIFESNLQLIDGDLPKICAYMLKEYARQIETYTKLINANENWVLVDIFADEGISGTKADNRPEFQKLIRLCELRQVDLILTKSISRFARNTKEALSYARRLKRLGVGIKFEKEGINTLSLGDEMLLSTFTALAQEESQSISQNQRLSITKRMERGEYVDSNLKDIKVVNRFFNMHHR